MQIHVNGELRETAEGTTVSALLFALDVRGDRVAVELNLEILDRSEFPSRVLKAGDRVELMSFIGGGALSGHRLEGDRGRP